MRGNLDCRQCGSEGNTKGAALSFPKQNLPSVLVAVGSRPAPFRKILLLLPPPGLRQTGRADGRLAFGTKRKGRR